MEKKQKTSLTWQLILTMVVIVAGTVAMCWFFNTTFLEKYYIFHKEKELKSSFDQVRLICEKQGDSDFPLQYFFSFYFENDLVCLP